MKLSDGEKLIVTMLADLMKAGRVRGEVDPDFIMEALGRGHSWAIRQTYHGLFHGDETEEEVVEETAAILNMCRVVEQAIQALSPDERASLPDQQAFFGFDGNAEPHYGVATMYVEKMDRWREFADRNLNSHMPMLDKYRRMRAVYEGTRRGIIQRFTRDEVERILSA